MRGFYRTIPSFLMAYGTKETKLENFDTIALAPVYNLRQWDALKSIKQNTLERDLAKFFPEMKSVK